jgi:uncharacterized protein with PIN domain
MSDKPINFVKREDLPLVCPHCENELTEVYTKAKGVPIIQGTNIVFFCPHCRKVLGFAQGRMI